VKHKGVRRCAISRPDPDPGGLGDLGREAGVVSLTRSALGNLIFLILGIAVAGRAPNSNTAASIANAVTFPMMFLSGTFFETSSLPSWLQEVVRFLPLTPLIKAMRKIAVDGDSITATGPELLLLVLWAAILFAVAARTFRFAER